MADGGRESGAAKTMKMINRQITKLCEKVKSLDYREWIKSYDG